MLKACKKCRMITEENECPSCGEEVSKNWQGYLIILDYENSAIAKAMGITENGKYALKVR